MFGHNLAIIAAAVGDKVFTSNTIKSLYESVSDEKYYAFSAHFIIISISLRDFYSLLFIFYIFNNNYRS